MKRKCCEKCRKKVGNAGLRRRPATVGVAREVSRRLWCVWIAGSRGPGPPEPRDDVSGRGVARHQNVDVKKTNKKNALAERTNKKGRTCTGDMGSPRCPYPCPYLRPMRHACNGHVHVVPCLSHMSSLPTLARLRFAATSKRHRAPWRRTWQPGSCDGSCPPASVCGEAIDGAAPS